VRGWHLTRSDRTGWYLNASQAKAALEQQTAALQANLAAAPCVKLLVKPAKDGNDKCHAELNKKTLECAELTGKIAQLEKDSKALEQVRQRLLGHGGCMYAAPGHSVSILYGAPSDLVQILYAAPGHLVYRLYAAPSQSMSKRLSSHSPQDST
jgi:hypothetical protein